MNVLLLVVQVVGVALVAGGAWLVAPAAGLIVAGVGLVAVAELVRPARRSMP